MEKLLPGQLVRAKAGRDKGKLFFIVQIMDENYVGIADGAGRKIQAPKKKKIMHLQICGFVSDVIKERLENGEKVENAFLRKQLALHQ